MLWLTACVLLSTAAERFLLFSSNLAVRGIPLTLSHQTEVILPVTGSSSIFLGIDFDAREKAIFFSDTKKNIIYRQKLDGTGENGFKVFFFSFLFCLFSIIILIICPIKLLHSLLKQDLLLSLLNIFR